MIWTFIDFGKRLMMGYSGNQEGVLWRNSFLSSSGLLFSAAQAVFSDVMYGFMPPHSIVAWLSLFLLGSLLVSFPLSCLQINWMV
jgi:hypothetical protein